MPTLKTLEVLSIALLAGTLLVIAVTVAAKMGAPVIIIPISIGTSPLHSLIAWSRRKAEGAERGK